MEQREGGKERCVKIQLVRQAWPDPTGPADNVNDIRLISKSHRKLMKGLWEKNNAFYNFLQPVFCV